MGDPNELLEPADVAAILKVPVATLYRWRHFGQGPLGFRIGRHVRFRRSDVELWVEQQRTAYAR